MRPYFEDLRERAVQRAEQPRPDIAFKRARWLAHQRGIDPRRLVFIDETWIKTNMTPLRGWGLRGRAARPLEDADLHRRPAA